MKKNKIKDLMKAIKTPFKKAIEPPIQRLHRERDMGQEAIDMGSHNAQEFFGAKDE